jgi:hypothetical protein
MTTQRAAIAAATLVATAVITVVVLASRTELTPPTITLDGAGITVSSGATTVRVRPEQIVSVSLEERLPPVSKRFGWGSSATLRGRYRLDGQPGYVNVARRHAPFVMVGMAHEFVLVNLPDPAKTRRLFEDIVRRWPSVRALRLPTEGASAASVTPPARPESQHRT